MLCGERREQGGECIRHGIAIKPVHPSYMGGLVQLPKGLFEAGQRDFPLSGYPYLTGCTGPTGTGEEIIYACPACTDAETAWRKAHRAPTWKDGVWSSR